MERVIDEKLDMKIGLILEYYANAYDVENVKYIVNKIQNLYDEKQPSISEIEPLLKELYRIIVKNEYHADLLREILIEIESME